MSNLLQRIERTLLFLTLLTLPTQIGRHFWPEFSSVYSLRVDYLSPVVYGWDLLVILLLLIWIFSRPRVNKLALDLLLIFLLSQMVSLLTNVNLGVGLVRAEQYLVSGLFGVYLASQRFDYLIKQFFWPLVLGIFMEAGLAIGQFIKGGTLGLWVLGERTFSLSTPGIAKFDFQGTQWLRPYGSFPHPNLLAAYMIIASSLLALIENVPSKIVFILSSLASATSVILSVSRTALLAGLAVVFLLGGKRWCYFLLIVIILISPILFTRFSALTSFDNLTFVRRAELAERALTLFTGSPIYGVGLNNFIPSLASDLVVGPNRFLQPVHNIFLLTLSETGLVGLLGLLVMFGYPIIKLFKLSPKPYSLNPILIIWTVVIFLGMFDHFFLTLPQGYRLLFLVWGVSLAAAAFNKQGES